ncbi:MAG: dimethylarginine dimethylaminohydrolase family protein [Anaerolineales bacterium]
MKQEASTHALVRPPGDSFARAISSSRAQPDAHLARAEHAEYCHALAAAGLSVEVLPPDESYPDSCFMQDPALVIAGQAIIGRLGAPSRQGEEAALAERLAKNFPLAPITAPGTLEGGDVMALPSRVLVGQSGRTNAAGIGQLAQILTPIGLAVEAVLVTNTLHLLTGVTHVGQNTVLAVVAYAAHPAFAGMEVITVPPEEAYAANVLAIGGNVILPAGYPRVARELATRGFTVLPVPMTQFAAADGGVTCLSLVW